MKCKCPACARTTQVPADLLDFLTRCERCGALLRPRLTASGHQGEPEKLIAQTIISGRYREDPFAQRASVLDILLPGPKLAIATTAPAEPPQQPTPNAVPTWHTHLQEAFRGLSETVNTLSQIASSALARPTPSAAHPSARSSMEPIPLTSAPAQSPSVELLAQVDTDDGPHDNLALEAANLAARQRALRRAQLQTSHHTLGWIGACGFTFVLLLLGTVLILKSTGIIGSPRSSFGGIMSTTSPDPRNPISADVLEPAGTQPASTQPGELYPGVGTR